MIGALKRYAGKLGRRFRGGLSSMVLVAMLGALGLLLLSGGYTSFLHPRFWPFLLAGALILTGFIVANVLGRPHPAVQSGGESVARSMVMLLPLIFLFTVCGQGMGEHALTKKYTVNEPGIPYIFSDDPPPEEGEEERAAGQMSLLEMNQQISVLGGRHVVTEGLTYTDANVPADHLLLFRFVIYCCAADATPVWVFVKKAEMEAFEPETWVKVSGTFAVANLNGKVVPTILADNITQLEPPAPGAQYLFF